MSGIKQMRLNKNPLVVEVAFTVEVASIDKKAQTVTLRCGSYTRTVPVGGNFDLTYKYDER